MRFLRRRHNDYSIEPSLFSTDSRVVALFGESGENKKKVRRAALSSSAPGHACPGRRFVISPNKTHIINLYYKYYELTHYTN